MSVNVAIGVQDFSTLIENHYFYVDKTAFLKEWWDSGDSVTLITRPRRFGKTLTMSMTEQFFSMEYAGRSDLFEELEIWNDEKYRNLQGTYPVISLATVYKGNIIKNLIMDCQSYTKYRPNETTGGIFVSWRRKEELPTGA